jgi:Acetyltransferase (GNAT) domain
MSGTIIVTGLPELDLHADQVDVLLQRTGAPVTAQWWWMRIWAATHPTWQPLAVLVGGGTGGLTAAALLARRHRGPVVEVVALGGAQSDYPWLPAVTPRDAEELAMGVRRALGRRPWRLRIDDLPEGDSSLSALLRILPVARVIPGAGAPVVDLTTGPAVADSLRHQARKSVRQGRNRLRTDGCSVQTLSTSDPAQVTALLPRLEAVHRARDRAARGATDLDAPDNRAFWHAVLSEAARRGALEITVMSVNGVIAGYMIALLDGGVYRSWDNRLVEEFGRYGIGHLVRDEVFRRISSDDRWTQFDWMIGTEPYKLTTANRVVPTQRMQAWSSPWLEHAEQLAKRQQERLRRSQRVAKGKLYRRRTEPLSPSCDPRVQPGRMR